MSSGGVANVNDTYLHYEVTGSGHPVVFVHGFSLDLRMWDDQMPAFARHYQLVRYDLRGHGRSAPPGSSGFYHADDLRALLDYLELERAHVVGLSLGAAIAAEFVLAYPERGTALVAADPVLWGHHWSPEHAASLDGLSEAGRIGGVPAARAFWLAHPLFAPALERPEVAARLRTIVGEYSGWHWIHDDPGLLPDPPAARRLEQITVPTLAMVGERDLPDYRVIAETLGQRVPGAHQVVLPGVGHLSNMEDPARFNDAVLDFLVACADAEY